MMSSCARREPIVSWSSAFWLLRYCCSSLIAAMSVLMLSVMLLCCSIVSFRLAISSTTSPGPVLPPTRSSETDSRAVGNGGSSFCCACGAVDGGSFCVGCGVVVPALIRVVCSAVICVSSNSWASSTGNGRRDDCCRSSCFCRTSSTSPLLSHLTRCFEFRSLAALANHKLAVLETKRNVATVITRTRAAITVTPYMVLNRNVK